MINSTTDSLLYMDRRDLSLCAGFKACNVSCQVQCDLLRIYIKPNRSCHAHVFVKQKNMAFQTNDDVPLCLEDIHAFSDPFGSCWDVIGVLPIQSPKTGEITWVFSLKRHLDKPVT